jgi:hypothetical protein
MILSSVAQVVAVERMILVLRRVRDMTLLVLVILPWAATKGPEGHLAEGVLAGALGEASVDLEEGLEEATSFKLSWATGTTWNEMNHDDDCYENKCISCINQ